MLWIGITGPMGSGKSTVGHLLRQMGFEVLDADQVARKVLSPGSAGEAEVLQTFGEHLKDERGHLDRRALGRYVFGDAARLDQLEKIVHPHVRSDVDQSKRTLERLGHQAVFYDVPLLFEKNMRAMFDHVLVVNSDKSVRHQRLKVRSQWTEEEIEERARHHIPAEIKEAAASAVIRNSGTLEDLRLEILNALKKIGVPLPTSTKT